MNRFLTPLTNAIIERKGTIDKYMGDAIMAFWNAPLDDDEHEVHACEAGAGHAGAAGGARSQRENEAERRRVFMPLRIGIGINPGRASSATWAPTSASTTRC